MSVLYLYVNFVSQFSSLLYTLGFVSVFFHQRVSTLTWLYFGKFSRDSLFYI